MIGGESGEHVGRGGWRIGGRDTRFGLDAWSQRGLCRCRSDASGGSVERRAKFAAVAGLQQEHETFELAEGGVDSEHLGRFVEVGFDRDADVPAGGGFAG